MEDHGTREAGMRGVLASPPAHASGRIVFVFGLLILVQVVGLIVQHPPFDTDDAAFFYRYAENLAAGNGYRFNAEEPPIWGASAPLWPLLLAVGVKAGLSAAVAAQVWSWVLTLTAVLLLGLAALRLTGPLGVLALAPLVGMNFLFQSYATSGMESPLGYALVAGGLALAAARGPGIALGVVAGLCVVHKIDLAPVGATIVAGAFLWRRSEAWRTLASAALIALSWYAFATWHFGSPIPNSFARKLNATYGDVSTSWFASRLFAGAGGIRIALALVGAWSQRARPYPVVIALVGILAPLAGFTLHPPPEPFEWYVAAASPGLALLGALGLVRLLSGALPRAPVARTSAVLAGLVALTMLFAYLDRPLLRIRNGYLSEAEPPRIAAGRWIDENTPADARVLCALGHVAYASRRFVYDQTFLNRRRETDSLVRAYRPEVVARHAPGAKASPGYTLVRRFESGRSPRGVDVYFRDDWLPGVARLEPTASRGPVPAAFPRARRPREGE